VISSEYLCLVMQRCYGTLRIVEVEIFLGALPHACLAVITCSLINLTNVGMQVWLCIGSQTMKVVKDAQYLVVLYLLIYLVI